MTSEQRCCPKCGAERTRVSQEYWIAYKCGSGTQPSAQSDRCRIAERDKQIAELTQQLTAETARADNAYQTVYMREVAARHDVEQQLAAAKAELAQARDIPMDRLERAAELLRCQNGLATLSKRAIALVLKVGLQAEED